MKDIFCPPQLSNFAFQIIFISLHFTHENLFQIIFFAILWTA